MDAVYIFCEHAVVKIPMYNYDKQIYSQLMEHVMPYYAENS